MARVKMPAAEVDIDEDLVATLIQQQHPDLAAPLRLVANGWDNVIFRLGTALSVRLPRRQLAADLVAKEQRWLPLLAAQLELPIPTPLRIGQPTEDFPWLWTISRWFPGRPLIDVPVARRSVITAELATFFASLHQPAPEDAPYNPVRGIPLEQRSPLMAEHLASSAIPEHDRVQALWNRLLQTRGWNRGPVWVHGDPHPANVLIDPDSDALAITAVIDFGDLSGGDPATDLAVAWLAFERAGRRSFKSQYERLTGPDDDLWTRARGWALSIAVSLLANSDDHPALAGVGRHGLEQVLTDEICGP
jgi:aminoglycoside phosphotransferase (APT) family kinase protein